MPIQQAVAHTDSYSHLNPGQRRAIEEVLISRDRVQGLQGFAGVGKIGRSSGHPRGRRAQWLCRRRLRADFARRAPAPRRGH